MEAAVSYLSWNYVSGISVLLMGVIAPLVLLIARSKTNFKNTTRE
jgi:hypothetical protein